jgi:hypothetical protein
VLKRVLITAMLIITWTSLCFAEANWEYIGGEDFYNEYSKATFHCDYYINVNSVSKVNVGMNEIIKAKIKVTQKPNEYSIDQFWVNNDTKQYKLAFSEEYNDGKLMRQSDYRNQSWNDYDPKSIIVNEILKRAN